MRISDWSSDVCSSDLFGQVLALGLGAAVISSADLPGVDKMQLGQAFVSDVLGEGEGGALMNTLIPASQGGGGGDSLFSGGMSFEAPGLDGLLESEGRRVGEEWVSTVKFREAQCREKTKKSIKTK